MSLYPIVRWDVITPDNVTMRPMIYIVPDLAFLEFAKANNFTVICEIVGTDTAYDNIQAPGIVDKSCYLPNCRPNFCEKTGLYVITLLTPWDSYPAWDKLGSVRILGFNKPKDMPIQKDEQGVYELPKTAEVSASVKQSMLKVSKTTKITGLVILGLLVVILALYFSRKKK
jgi:hypothetical protein